MSRAPRIANLRYHSQVVTDGFSIAKASERYWHNLCLQNFSCMKVDIWCLSFKKEKCVIREQSHQSIVESQYYYCIVGRISRNICRIYVKTFLALFFETRPSWLSVWKAGIMMNLTGIKWSSFTTEMGKYPSRGKILLGIFFLPKSDHQYFTEKSSVKCFNYQFFLVCGRFMV